MAKGRPDYTPTAADVVSRPEWAAKEGTDKAFSLPAADVAADGQTTGSYLVPAGKTLYISQLCVFGYATAVANRDLNQNVGGSLWELLPYLIHWTQAGFGGCAFAFPQPIPITAGRTITFSVYNLSNHNQTIGMTVRGYEL